MRTVIMINSKRAQEIKLKLDELWKLPKKQLVTSVELSRRVVDTREADKGTLVSMLLENYFTSRELAAYDAGQIEVLS